MNAFTGHDVIVMFLGLGVLLVAARTLGELARAVNQPMVLGEIIAGIVLGPTILGTAWPEAFQFLFPKEGRVGSFFDGLTLLAVVLFLLVAGMEVDLSRVWRQGKAAVLISAGGLILPFAVGFGAAWGAPHAMGMEAQADVFVFALFFGVALCISALPVIAKTLMDLNIYRSDLGMLIISAAIVNDLIGWMAFAAVLNLMQSGAGSGPVIGSTMAMTVLFVGLTLTVGRMAIHRVLPWVQAHTSWPGGVLVFAMSLAFFGAALTKWIGIHAIFGSFLVGIAIGDSAHLREQTRATLHQFISFIFAPLFFGSIGLTVNFAQHFDWKLTLVVVVVACLGKVLGCGWGARWGGLPAREAWAVGFGMNARGAMEIILGLLALQHGVIGVRLFVALVIMSLATSAISGPMIRSLLDLKKARHFTDFLAARGLIAPLRAGERLAAIRELSAAVPLPAGVRRDDVEEAVIAREQLMSTGLGDGIAVPHARLAGFDRPAVVVGLSPEGVDFDARDGTPAHLVFLIITPSAANVDQVSILADIARTFARPEVRQAALAVRSITELRALLRTNGGT